MGLKQTSAHIVVQRKSEVVIQAFNTYSWLLVLAWRVVDSAAEERGEPLERVLVHWVDHSQVHDGEEQDLSTVRDVSVLLSRLIDLLLSDR